MASYLAWTSPYLAHLQLSSGDQTRAEALIAAASAAIDGYTHRFFDLAERDQTFFNRTGEIMLPAYPIDHVARVCTSAVDVLTVQGTGQVCSFSVTGTALKLVRIVAGVRTNSSLSFATYTTLGSLAAVVSAVSGWSATAASGYQDYPSADLVEGQSGNCAGTGAALALWTDTAGTYQIDIDRGLVLLRGNWSQAWLTDSDASGPERVRIVWTGGYSSIPADLQQVCAALVSNAWDERQGVLQSESLGEYNYTLSDVNLNKLPVTSRKILDSYKDRII